MDFILVNRMQYFIIIIWGGEYINKLDGRTLSQCISDHPCIYFKYFTVFLSDDILIKLKKWLGDFEDLEELLLSFLFLSSLWKQKKCQETAKEKDHQTNNSPVPGPPQEPGFHCQSNWDHDGRIFTGAAFFHNFFLNSLTQYTGNRESCHWSLCDI